MKVSVQIGPIFDKKQKPTQMGRFFIIF